VNKPKSQVILSIRFVKVVVFKFSEDRDWMKVLSITLSPFSNFCSFCFDCIGLNIGGNMVVPHRKVLDRQSVRRQPFYERPKSEEEVVLGDDLVVVVVAAVVVVVVEVGSMVVDEEVVDHPCKDVVVVVVHPAIMAHPVNTAQDEKAFMTFLNFDSGPYRATLVEEYELYTFFPFPMLKPKNKYW